MDKIEIRPIGVVRSPFKEPINVPIQPCFSEEAGFLEIDDEFVDGLKDLDGFSHIILLYKFHKSDGYKMRVKPFLDKEERGLFATRAPKRPNGIGLSIVRLNRVVGNKVFIENIDIIDGTPLLDIKPYFDIFDDYDCKDGQQRFGWLEKSRNNPNRKIADKRFTTPNKDK